MRTIVHMSMILLMCHKTIAQPNWQNLDRMTDSVMGISTERAYHDLLKNKKAVTILVAVIDSGIDTLHEDIKTVLWNNPGEILGNGVDDDHNGYADDGHGWNFIGGVKGDVVYDNLEMTRLMRMYHAFYDSLAYTAVPEGYRAGYQQYRKMKRAFDKQSAAAKTTLANVKRFKTTLDSILTRIGKSDPSIRDVENYSAPTDNQREVAGQLVRELQRDPVWAHLVEQVNAIYDHFDKQVSYALNPDYDPRPIVGDDYPNSAQRNYGNNNVYGTHAEHGTHVAGIIGAVRDNGSGIQGVADHVRILPVRAIPDGDERDKDVANAIRYAVENGARVINMSFGKPYSSDKKVVDEAVKYAMNKNVLLIRAAGNEAKDLDDPENIVVPNKYYADSSGEANAWITVGASGPNDDASLAAGFSNYGRKMVDVFAPGVHIYSCIPGSRYDYMDGTSMAAPVVSGLAALIWSYYPRLTAVQIKEIIMRSVSQRACLKNKCVSGGVVNAYNALQLAEKYK